MPSIKPFGLALLVLGLSACASLGQSGNRDNEVKVAAQKLIGQPAGKAFELFGKLLGHADLHGQRTCRTGAAPGEVSGTSTNELIAASRLDL